MKCENKNCFNTAQVGIDNHKFCVPCYESYFYNLPPLVIPDWYGLDKDGNRKTQHSFKEWR